MHKYNVHDAFYQNCKIHVAWVMGSGLRVVSLWPVKMYKIFKKSSLLPNAFKKRKYMILMFMKPFT